MGSGSRLDRLEDEDLAAGGLEKASEASRGSESSSEGRGKESGGGGSTDLGEMSGKASVKEVTSEDSLHKTWKQGKRGRRREGWSVGEGGKAGRERVGREIGLLLAGSTTCGLFGFGSLGFANVEGFDHSWSVAEKRLSEDGGLRGADEEVVELRALG